MNKWDKYGLRLIAKMDKLKVRQDALLSEIKSLLRVWHTDYHVVYGVHRRRVGDNMDNYKWVIVKGPYAMYFTPAEYAIWKVKKGISW